MIAIIGGSGIYSPDIFADARELTISTPYGEVNYVLGQVDNRDTVFMTRHGKGHSVPPHLVNYRANIWALKKLGVQKIIATAAVGSVDPEVKPGMFVIADDFLDFTKSRHNTFFDGQDGKVLHVDVSSPYCPALRASIAKVFDEMQIEYKPKGCYIATEGPRFESPAEIKLYNKIGGTIIGMTGIPECVLAREAEMCYANLSMVTNLAAGLSGEQLSHKEVFDMMNSKLKLMQDIIRNIIIREHNYPSDGCGCANAAHEVGGFKV